MAYDEFLDFLKLGCGGSPRQGYPAVLVIVSTVPNEVLGLHKNGLDQLFTSFWAAVDGRALGSLTHDRLQNSAAFLSSVLECLILLLNRLAQDEDAAKSALSESLVHEQFDELCSALYNGRLTVQSEFAGEAMAKALARLEGFNDKSESATFSSHDERSSRTLLQ